MTAIGTYILIIAFFVFLTVIIIIVSKSRNKKKYNKKLTVLKDVGGQTVKEIEFMVKEELLPLSKDNLNNTAWFLVTKKINGKKYIWPRPPFSQWVTDDHCYIYSKSYKGNNYACLIEQKKHRDKIIFVETKAGTKEKTKKEEYLERTLAIENSFGELLEAQFFEIKSDNEDQEEKDLGIIDVATHSAPIIFPKTAHHIEPIFDERYLPEVVALHTTLNQIFAFESWWNRNERMILVGAVVGIVLISAIFNFKMLQEVKDGPIQHDLTVHVEASNVDYTKTVEETPPPPPSTPSGGKFAGIVKDVIKDD